MIAIPVTRVRGDLERGSASCLFQYETGLVDSLCRQDQEAPVLRVNQDLVGLQPGGPRVPIDGVDGILFDHRRCLLNDLIHGASHHHKHCARGAVVINIHRQVERRAGNARA